MDESAETIGASTYTAAKDVAAARIESVDYSNIKNDPLVGGNNQQKLGELFKSRRFHTFCN